MSFRPRNAECPDPACYEMPALEGDSSIGRSADRIEREAYEKGYASGEKAGFEMGERKARVLIDKLEALLGDVASLGARIAKEAEPQCVELSVAIARKILARELTARPEEIVAMAKEGILKLERTGRVTVKVNPLIFDFVAKHRPDLAAIHPDIVFEADPSVPGHGTVVIGATEEVVTDLDEQVRNLIKDMGERLKD